MNFSPKIFFRQEFKGLLFLVFGSVLLLHTLGVFQRLFGGILIIASVFFMIYGFVEARAWHKIKEYMKKRENNNSEV